MQVSAAVLGDGVVGSSSQDYGIRAVLSSLCVEQYYVLP